MQNIVNAKVNNSVQSDVLNDFRVVYKKIYVLKPEISENFVTRPIYPQECRLREMTYCGNIMIDLEVHGVLDSYDSNSLGSLSMNGLCIGKMPIMLGSDYCWLNDKGSVGFEIPNQRQDSKTISITQKEKNKILAKLEKKLLNLTSKEKESFQEITKSEEKALDLHGECEGDPQGYFIIKGTEKVVLMQEQLCKNKVLMEPDWKKNILQASCASATLETKSKIGIVLKNNRLFLKSSSFKELISLPIIFKAMGSEADRVIARLVNVASPKGEVPEEQAQFEREELDLVLHLTLEDTEKLGVRSREDAVRYLVGKIKYHFKFIENRTVEEKTLEVHNILSKIILPHVSVQKEDYKHKVTFMSFMARKLLRFYFKSKVKGVNSDLDISDNRDYLGNKRVECAGEMMALLFEDLFKRFNVEFKKELDKNLLRSKKRKRERDFIQNVIKMICSSDTITHGLRHALSSGNWSIKR
jgi:DNA-directed RNA polymerase III subunit RPC2